MLSPLCGSCWSPVTQQSHGGRCHWLIWYEKVLIKKVFHYWGSRQAWCWLSVWEGVPLCGSRGSVLIIPSLCQGMQAGCAQQPEHREEIPASTGACGATEFPMGAALLTPNRQQGWSHSQWRPSSFSPWAVLFGAGSLGPVSYRFVSYIKKPVKLNTLREWIPAPEQSLLLSLSYQRGLQTGEGHPR